MTDQEVIMGLGRIAYKVDATRAAIEGVRERIKEGSLTKVRVAEILTCYGNNLIRYAESLKAMGGFSNAN